MEKTAVDIIGRAQRLVVSLRNEYISWILTNPGRASDTESGIKLVSYLLHGRFSSTTSILPELLYCGANLLSFWHDRILLQHRLGTAGPALSPSQREKQVVRIRSILTVIDYLEVFLEVGARQVWGEGGKWLVILLIQCVKTGLRAALLLYYKTGMVGSSTLYQRRCARTKEVRPNVTFVLKHSGKTVRKVEGAPPVKTRDWTVPEEEGFSITELPKMRKVAEVIHVLRPLTHLASMGIFGQRSWKPWLISFAMDMTSLKLHSEFTSLKRSEKLELTRRTYALCYYLMRSPFYDTYTKKRLLGVLVTFSERIPLIGNVCGVLAQAIPEWQNTYSYMWTNY